MFGIARAQLANLVGPASDGLDFMFRAAEVLQPSRPLVTHRLALTIQSRAYH